MRLIAITAVLVLAGCSGGDGSYDFVVNNVDDSATEAAEEARQAVYEARGAESDGTNADAGNVAAHDVEDSGDYVCTDDCSGHEAGFEWAQDNDITDASDCGGNSQSFVEGCEALADERQQQADSEAQEAAEEAAEEAADEAESDAEYEAEAEDY